MCNDIFDLSSVGYEHKTAGILWNYFQLDSKLHSKITMIHRLFYYCVQSNYKFVNRRIQESYINWIISKLPWH